MSKKIIGITVGTPIKPDLFGGGNGNLDEYVKKFDGSNEQGNLRFTVYGQNMGEEQNVPYSSNAKEFTLAQYTSGGNLIVAEPRQSIHATTKTYVDNGLTALAIPNVISGGGKSISVSDVSPLVHNCSCRLTSDTSGSSNLFMPTTENFSLNMTHTINSDGSILATGYTSGQGALTCTLTGLIPNERYTFSLRSNNSSAWRLSIFGVVQPITASGNESIAFFEEYHATFVCPENGAVKIMIGQWVITDTTTGYDGSIIFYPQLELGDTMTEWQSPFEEGKPYIEDFSTVKVFVGGKSYTPSENGTVIGIESTSPNMEITTDNEHANIHDFAYCVDTKKYIDNAIAQLKAELQGGS